MGFSQHLEKKKEEKNSLTGKKKKSRSSHLTILESRIWKHDPSQSFQRPGIKCCYFWWLENQAAWGKDKVPSGYGRKQSRVVEGRGSKADLTGGICRQLGQKRNSPSFGPPPPIGGRRDVHVSPSGFPSDSSALFLPSTLGNKPQWRLNPTSAPPGDLFFLKCSISRESEGPPLFGKATGWRYFYALSAVGERESWLKIEPVMPSSAGGLGQRQSQGTTHVWEYNSLCLLPGSLFQPSLSQHMDAHKHANTCKHTCVHAHEHMQAHKCTRAHMSPHTYACQHACTHRQACTTSPGACWLSLCHGHLVQFKNYSERVLGSHVWKKLRKTSDTLSWAYTGVRWKGDPTSQS